MIINRMANSVDPDETTHYESSHLDLHCLHRYLDERVKLYFGIPQIDN